MKKIIIYFLLRLAFSEVCCQNVLNVATQRFEERIAFEANNLLQLDVEKAHVSISGWDKLYYEFEILLKSKHQDQDQAVRELSYLKYELEKDSNSVYLSNYFGSGEKFQKVQGILSLEITIWAPRSSEINIKNAYGTVNVSEMSAPINISGKFVETNVNDCEGTLKLTATFGDNRIKNHQGALELDLTRVNLSAERIYGKVSGNAYYGVVEITDLITSNVNIDAKRTQFILELENPLDNYDLTLSSLLGQVTVGYPFNKKQMAKWNHESPSKSSINISTTYSPVTITGKPIKVQSND